jgi:hypothetical protein
MADCEMRPRVLRCPHRVVELGAAARAECGILLPAQRAAVAGKVKAAVEGGIAPVGHLRTFAPPEEPLGVVNYALLLGQFDQRKKIVHAHTGKQRAVSKIHL